jgi:hypothetical protein
MAETNDKTLDTLIDAGADVLRLSLDPAWKPAILANLKVTLGHAAAVASFDMPDEAEPAPVFRA